MKTNFRKFFAVLSLGVSTAFIASGCYAQPLETPNWKDALYVSPHGNDSAAGTREKPFATIKKALSVLSPEGGGLIALLGGTYKESASIGRPDGATGEAKLLTITAVPGEEVIFQGGEPITKWTSWNGEKGLYMVEAPDRQSLHSRTGYLDVWENSARVRYRSQFDADGVRAYPGSVCLLDDKRILIHTSDGREPRELDLWRNRAAAGLGISRDNVAIRGIRFENYLGGSDARAITIGSNRDTNYKGIVIDGCTIVNCVQGMSVTANGPRIVNCTIRDVGLGLVSYGVDMVVDNCIIQSATGAFAVSDLNQHMRDGIRYYSPARGGTVTGCVTAGFWTGLYIKCNTPGPDARPMLIQNNIFLDGIRAGSAGPQPKNRYVSNIIGPNEERVDPMKDNLLKTATFEANYFFNRGGSTKGSNIAGDNPFVDLPGGDLNIKPGIALPVHSNTSESARKATQIQWSPRLAMALARSLSPEKTATTELKFIKSPTAAASAQGAIISARLSAPAESTLRYRKVGTTDWQTAKGIDNTLSRPEVIIGSAPVERDAAPEYGVLFTLLDKQLEANSDYEYSVEATMKGAATVRSETKTLRTSGGAKQIIVRADSDASKAAGTTEHSFTQLQDALDHALPGDTIQLEKGVYTSPAILVHGGTAQAPLTIQGAGEQETILDGGKEPPVMLELRKTGNIVIRDLQVRWFGNAGISATNAENVTVERCRFFNAGLRGSESSNGSGIYLADSPGWTISHSIFAKLEHGVSALRSPQLKLLNNTAYQNMYDGVSLYHSAQGSVITGNSFTFTGNDSITISEPDKKALASLVCDYNNYGAVIRASEKVRPENEIKPSPRYGYIGAGKAMGRFNIVGKLHRFNRLDDWRKFTGMDAHSIFADPQYVDPLSTDFRLMAGSPNILPDGRVIGAASVPVVAAR